MDSSATNCLIYTRRAIEAHEPIPVQEAALSAAVEAKGWNIVGKFGDDVTEHQRVDAPRPSLRGVMQELMRGASTSGRAGTFRAPPPGMLCVPTLAALAPNPHDLGERLAELDAASAGLYVHDIQVDTRTPEGALWRRALDGLLAFIFDTQSERGKRIHRRAKKIGQKIGHPRVSIATEAQVELLVLNQIPVTRIVRLTRAGNGTVYRIRKALVTQGLMEMVPGGRYRATERGKRARAQRARDMAPLAATEEATRAGA